MKDPHTGREILPVYTPTPYPDWQPLVPAPGQVLDIQYEWDSRTGAIRTMPLPKEQLLLLP